MRVFSRIGIISTFSMGVMVMPDSAWARQPSHSLHSLRAPSGDRELRLSDATDRPLAVHFLVGDDTPECSAFVTEFLRRSPELAGVRHVFVKPGDASAVKSWAAQFGDGADAVYLDPGATLAMDLHVPNATPAIGAPPRVPTTVVLGPGGMEMFRHVGRAQDDFIDFTDFSRRLNAATRAQALADYNLPQRGGPAVEGYDVVAYFTLNKAVRGKPSLTSAFRGVMYQFDSESNRSLFAAAPERYVPTYGGWCASAMGKKGTKVEIDPKNFKVKDGRLFLFYKSVFGDALADWNEHEQEWEPAADRNWKKLTGEDPAAPGE